MGSHLTPLARTPVGICLGLGLAAAIAVGLGRFAYALVLPAMQQAFAWSYSEAGSLNAANSLGYLAGALAATALAARAGIVSLFVSASIVGALALGLTALPSGLGALLALRVGQGLVGALAFVTGGVLAARVASGAGTHASRCIGAFYTGPGIGMLGAGLTGPALLAWSGDWRWVWIGYGAAALVLALIAAWAARQVPVRGPAPALARPAEVTLAPALVSYFFFAAGYIGYMTFIIVTVGELGAGSGAAAGWWMLMALAAIVSFWVLGPLLAAADGRALGLLNALCAVGAFLALAGRDPMWLAMSMVLFAGTFLVIVAATTNMVRVARPAARWARWIGYFTVAFGVGQIVGPLASGFAADLAGDARAVLWVSGGLLAVAAGCALFQPATRPAPEGSND